MIARHDVQIERTDLWSKLAAPLPAGVISWRQDGRPVQRDGKFFSRFVAYIEANTVRERLDSVVPGEWDLTLELLPSLPLPEDAAEGPLCSFKARLQVVGVIREDVGTGRDYKQAATDAFKRAAVRFGIAHELYAYEQNWIQMDGDGRYAKPLEDPQAAYTRRYGPVQPQTAEGPGDAPRFTVSSSAGPEEGESCPKCGGRMWDNRATKRNPRAPDFKCRDRSCDGVIWPAKATAAGGAREEALQLAEPAEREVRQATGTDDLPF